jgi:hypothetical protein
MGLALAIVARRYGDEPWARIALTLSAFALVLSLGYVLWHILRLALAVALVGLIC